MQHNVKRFCQATAHALLLAHVMADCAHPPEPKDGIYSFWLGASALGMHLAYSNVPMGTTCSQAVAEARIFPGSLCSSLRCAFCTASATTAQPMRGAFLPRR